MATDVPQISVAVVAHNEGRHIQQTLECLAAQTHPSFLVTVYDNGSTDDTAAKAQAMAERDNRFRLVSHPTDIGAVANFNHAMRAAIGDYLLIAGGHDVFDTDYLELLARRLDSNPKLVLAFARSVWIDADGLDLAPTNGLYVTEGVSSPLRRFNVYMWANAEPFHGLMRISALQRTDLLPRTIAPVQVLLQQMAILGQFAYVPETTFHRRRVRVESRDERISRYQRVMFGGRPVPLPYFHTSAHVVRAALRTPLAGGNQRRMRWQLVLSSLGVIPRMWPYYADDVRDLPSVLRQRWGDESGA